MAPHCRSKKLHKSPESTSVEKLKSVDFSTLAEMYLYKQGCTLVNIVHQKKNFIKKMIISF